MNQHIPRVAVVGTALLFWAAVGTSGAANSAGVTETSNATVFVKVDRQAGSKRFTTVGSAIVLRSDGFLITTHSCVASEVKVWANGTTQGLRTEINRLTVVIDSGTEDELEIPARIVIEDPINGLALLKVGHTFPSSVAIDAKIRSQVGDSIVVAGFPFGGELGENSWFDENTDKNPVKTAKRGKVTSLRGRKTGQAPLIETSIEISPGYSGAPMMNAAGNIVGVVSPGLRGGRDVAFAIPLETIRDFVDWCAYKVVFRPVGIYPGLRQLAIDIVPVLEDLDGAEGSVYFEGRDVPRTHSQFEATDVGLRADLQLGDRLYGVTPPSRYSATLKLRIPGATDDVVREFLLPATETLVVLETRQDVYWTGENSIFADKTDLSEIAKGMEERERALQDGDGASKLRRSGSGSIVIDQKTVSSFATVHSGSYDELENGEQKKLAMEYDSIFWEFCALTEESLIPLPKARPGMTSAQYSRLIQSYRRDMIDGSDWLRRLMEVADRAEKLGSKLRSGRIGKCKDGAWRQGNSECRVPGPANCG